MTDFLDRLLTGKGHRGLRPILPSVFEPGLRLLSEVEPAAVDPAAWPDRAAAGRPVTADASGGSHAQQADAADAGRPAGTPGRPAVRQPAAAPSQDRPGHPVVPARRPEPDGASRPAAGPSDPSEHSRRTGPVARPGGGPAGGANGDHAGRPVPARGAAPVPPERVVASAGRQPQAPLPGPQPALRPAPASSVPAGAAGPAGSAGSGGSARQPGRRLAAVGERTVQITIGRLEVRAPGAATVPAARPSRRQPSVSLQQYLNRPDGGERR